MELHLTDKRMLKLIDDAVQLGKARNESEYLAMIGFSRTNISNVRRGHQSFNREHIAMACQVTGANANWILGVESSPKMRKQAKDAISKAREAIDELEGQLNKKLNSKKKTT